MTSQIHLKGIYPDVHVEKITAHFAHVARPDLEADRQVLQQTLDKLKVFYVVGFTNRCGSNFLAQCLASDGRLRQATEGLNFDTVINQSGRHGLRSFEAYLAWLIQRQLGQTHVFGIKASVGQLIGLSNSGLLGQVRDRLQVIHISRKDVLEQAISYYIASRTRQWTSTQKAQDVALDYKPNEILGIAEAIARQNSAFSMLWRLLGIDPVRVDYAKLVAEPDKTVRRIGKRLGLRDLKLVHEKLTYEKQADERNQLLLRSMALDFSLYPSKGITDSVEEDNSG